MIDRKPIHVFMHLGHFFMNTVVVIHQIIRKEVFLEKKLDDCTITDHKVLTIIFQWTKEKKRKVLII